MAKKHNPCTFCDTEIKSKFSLIVDDHKFCCSYCAVMYSKRTITELRSSIAKWKEAWFEQREIIGDLGLEYIILPRFERNRK